jgi:hypothetical protein
VIRYQGQPIPEHARIALISNDAIGNYVVITPLVEMLRRRYPRTTITYFGGTRTEEFWRKDDRFTSGYPLFGSPPHCLAEVATPSFDWVINVEWLPWAKASAAILAGETGFVTGPCLDSSGRADLPFAADQRGELAADQNWISDDITLRYPFLHSGFIGEIFCRLAYQDGQVPRYRVPREEVVAPVDVLIAMSASLPEKLWSGEKWMEAVTQLRKRGLSVGLLGAKPSTQKGFWKGSSAEDDLVDAGLVEDLRGRYSLPQVAGVLASARQVLTLDNGIMHLAAATDTPTVGLFRRGLHRLWTPPNGNVAVVLPPGDTVEDIEVDRALGAMVV